MSAHEAKVQGLMIKKEAILREPAALHLMFNLCGTLHAHCGLCSCSNDNLLLQES